MGSVIRGAGALVRAGGRTTGERHRRRRVILLAFGLGFVSARPLHAETTASVPRGGIAIHPEVGFALPLPSGSDRTGNGRTPGIYHFGLSVGYQLTQRYEVELGLGYAGAGQRAALPVPGDPRREIATPPGVFIRGLGRAGFGLPWLRAVVGAGPTMFVGDYGVVPLVDLEAGVELRARRGPYLLIAYEVLEPIIFSRKEFDPARCVTDDCPSRFNPADPIAGIRVAGGISF
jgi:hypothetical protein